MPEQTIVAFDREGLRLGLYVFLWRYEVLTQPPIVRHDLGNQRAFDGVP